jgi:calcineurin-like phosphoesterase family protein
MKKRRWFSADWHLGHNNIVRGCSRWENKNACRDFDTLKEHDEAILDGINSCANADDTIYFLGDFSFGGKEMVAFYRNQIRCKNIHFIYGNHDHHIRNNRDNCQELFTSLHDIMYPVIDTELFVLCHYAMRTWQNAHHGSIMLYGHSHGTLSPYQLRSDVEVSVNGEVVKNMQMPIRFKTMDVGIDTHPQMRLYSLEELRSIMSQSIPLRADDHHDENYI